VTDPIPQPTPAPATGPPALATPAEPERRKGPLSFLSGALTAGLLSWLCLGLSRRLALYYALHPPHYASAIAQSIATALKTLIVGMAFLATFSFAFIALGLTLVLVRSLVGTPPQASDSDGEAA
jgi:hypothetical protein